MHRLRPSSWSAATRSLLALALAAQFLVVATQMSAEADPALGTDWPMFHHDALHQGVSSDQIIRSDNVANMGLRWQANVAGSYTSPVVVYNATLGKTLVLLGSNNGTFAAYDASTGERVWFYKPDNAAIQSSPAVDGNVVYFGSNDHYLYALNVTTGALICRFNAGATVYASPVIADPDGTGKLVYFGDSGPSGSDDGGHFWAVNAVDPNAAQDCTVKWSYGSFGQPEGSQPLVGVWSPPAFATDVTGRNLVVFGGGSPEGAIYALDATTGQRVWRFQTQTFTADQDVGAAPTISPPGVNGFADGVVYVAGKDAIMHAVNLRTGALIWTQSIRNLRHGATRSGAALVGRTIYFGNGVGPGVIAVDAITGARVWTSLDIGTPEVISSPAVTGTLGSQVLVVGDTNGTVYAHSLSTGAILWSYDTGGLIYGSAAISGGMVFIANATFLYAFGVGGVSASGPPDTTITSPANNATVTNPNGNQVIRGTATDDTHVDHVLVTIQDANAQLWWNQTTSAWENVVAQNLATLSSPSATSTNWTYSFPAPQNGGPFTIQAEAVDADGQHDPSVAQTAFTLTSRLSPPTTTITRPLEDQLFTFPGGVRQSFNIVVRGRASDPRGTPRGIAAVYLIIQNVEHTEYFCGPVGCGGGETGRWAPTQSVVQATLTTPNANWTAWQFTFPTYDHPHTYKITAWAVDRNGNPDPTRAVISRICVRDRGGTCP